MTYAQLLDAYEYAKKLSPASGSKFVDGRNRLKRMLLGTVNNEDAMNALDREQLINVISWSCEYNVVPPHILLSYVCKLSTN